MRWWPGLLALAACYQDVPLVGGGGGAGMQPPDSGPVSGDAGSGVVPAGTTLHVFAGQANEVDSVPILVLVPASTPQPIAFFDKATTQQLPYESGLATGDGHIETWVLLDKLPTLGQDIVLASGPGTSGSSDPAAVWRDYEFVTHLGDLDTDATGNHSGGIAQNVFGTPAEIGNGAAFNGSDSSLRYTNATDLFDGWTELTLELWVNIPSAETSSGQVVSETNGLFGVEVQGSPPHMLATISCTSASPAKGTVAVTGDRWNAVAYVYDGAVFTAYLDGASQTTDTSCDQSPLVNTSGEALTFGSTSVAPLHGALDEIRVSRQQHSQDYLLVEYEAGLDELVTPSL